MEKKITALLRELVAINSVFPGEKKLGDHLVGMLKKEGYSPTVQMFDKNRFNILVEKGFGDRSIMLYSHLDTVGVTDGWKGDPLKLKISGDQAYGLGAWDMKAGMAANICAFLDHNPREYKLKMVFCSDEENISKGGHLLASSGYMDDVDCIISCEPSFFHGNNGIVIGRPGRAVFMVDISAQPKHYALYDKKYDMNFFAVDLVYELGKFYRKERDRKQFVFVRSVQSKSLGISTPMNISMELDSSVIPPNSSEKLMKSIRDTAVRLNRKYGNYFKIAVNLKTRETPFLEPYEIDRKNIHLRKLSDAVKKVTGKKAIPYFRSSVADENIFGSMGKTVFSIGPTGGNAHSPNEWVSLESTVTLYTIIKDFLSSENLPQK